MSCQQTILDYGLRSLGYGERLLPKSDFTLCQHFTLIGSGLIWNIYFGALALLIGFFIANAMALAKASPRAILRRPAEWFILIFRGSPLFIQFFLAYFIFLRLKQQGLLPWLTRRLAVPAHAEVPRDAVGVTRRLALGVHDARVDPGHAEHLRHPLDDGVRGLAHV